ncbi:hypothetical protein OG883_46275 [Streptomyces sp. NBC_01142]|uniref:AbiJ-NTD4 domain-containing protein n=2 Tax=Streptomyces TaxID=1883 RepID=UPI002257711E|nr:hypothetical protein [Streptomyces sp. NBC_01142]MCX4827048.1 hypothetical protein [Streptomyces sp. NBC_01142]
MTDLYSTREGLGPRRDRETITPGAWQGITALIGQWANNGSLARHFPLYECVDDRGRNTITGTDMGMFLRAITGHIPDLAVTPQPDGLELERSPLDPYSMPDTASVLDLIEFVARYIDKPIDATNHPWGGNHTDYTFRHGDGPDPFSDRKLSPGEAELRDKVNEIFERNGIAYIVSDTMQVQRLGPVEARLLVSEFRPSTGDARLDGLLDDAMGRFLSRKPADRQDAVEKLWDAFERLKTLEGNNKAVAGPKLIEDAALSSEPFRKLLSDEFHLLTQVGNNFTIRHHELAKTPPPSDDARDYLFVRLASVIAVVLRHTGRMA